MIKCNRKYVIINDFTIINGMWNKIILKKKKMNYELLLNETD